MSLDWRRFIVAESAGGEVIACGQIKPHRDGSQELASIAVTQDWRGQGVARAIIEHLIAGHTGDLYLMCVPDMAALYLKFGFYIVEDIEALPTYFRRVSKIVGAARTLAKGIDAPTIMKRNRRG
mgnify:CR=1 FL=1